MKKISTVLCTCLKSFGSAASIALFALPAQAAPIPGMGSSKLIAPELGIFRSANGFQISAGGSGWIHIEAPTDNKFIETVYRAPELESSVAEALSAPKTANKKARRPGEGASLTVRIDKLEKELALERYVQRWLKEYPRYGFDVLSSKSFVQNKHKGYVLDLVNRDSQRQLRQVIFMKKGRAAILTCRDDVATFRDSLLGCNQIIRTFNWTE